jgi:hypothetical protein
MVWDRNCAATIGGVRRERSTWDKAPGFVVKDVEGLCVHLSQGCNSGRGRLSGRCYRVSALFAQQGYRRDTKEALIAWRGLPGAAT